MAKSTHSYRSQQSSSTYWQEFLLVAKTHWAEYRKKPLLNIGFMISLAIATSTLLCILILNDASKQQYHQANTRLKSPIAFHVVHKQKKLISVDDFSRLRALGFHQLNGIHWVKKRLSTGKSISLYGLDILPLVLSAPERYQVNNINVSKQYAATLGLESAIGTYPKQLHLTDKKGTAEQVLAKSSLPLHINNINDWGNVALLDITHLWQLFPDTKGFSHFSSSYMSPEQQSRLATLLPEHLTIQAVWSLEEREGFADALHLNLAALAILGFIVSMFIAYQAGDQAWKKRSELAAQLRLLGVELKLIKAVMLTESIVLTFIAGVMGLGIAIALVGALLPVLGLTLEQLYQLRLTGHFQWQWHYGLWALLLSGSAVFLSLVKQFNVISSAQVALSARQKAPTFSYKLSAITAMGLMLAFVFLPNISEQHTWHHLMLKYGLLLLASVALLPVILKYMLVLLSKVVKRFSLRFIFKDASQQVGRRYLPLAAFYLALTASISAALMVHSFESAFVSYLNQLLNSDAFVSYNPSDKEKVSQWIKRQESISGHALYEHTTVQFRTKLFLEKNGLENHGSDKNDLSKNGLGKHKLAKHGLEKVSVYALANKRQSQGLLFKEGGLSDDIQATNYQSQQSPKSQKNQLSACYINEQFSFKHQVKLKQVVDFEQGSSKLSCQVMGIYYDYGNHGLAVKIPTDYAHTYLSNWSESGFGLYFKSGVELSKQQIIEGLNVQDDQVFIPQQIKKLALDVFKQTFVLTQAIAFVLLSIACFGLFLSANGLELARKPDLHILSSLGYSRIELLKHMLTQWFVLAGGAVLLSWPVATILANALVSQILPVSFGWSMPLSLDVLAFAISSLLGLAILLPALGIPLYKLNVRASLS